MTAKPPAIDDHVKNLPASHQITETVIPAFIADHGTAARYAWEEFFIGNLRNAHTRRSYLQAVRQFLHWCEQQCVDLPRITPGLIGRYFDQHTGSAPTRKLHMSAIRGLLDTLVQRHVIVLNPALSVKTPRYSVLEGKTPEITVAQVRILRAAIILNTAIDYRDRAIISMLTYTAARVGAIAKLRVGDLGEEANSLIIRFREKGGRHRKIPARISLQQDIQEYLDVAPALESNKHTPLFRSASGRTQKLTDLPMSTVDMSRMLKRRLQQADLPSSISCHSFRSCAATDLLLQQVPLCDVQNFLGHADPRVTRLYDRRHREVTRNIVERISV